MSEAAYQLLQLLLVAADGELPMRFDIQSFSAVARSVSGCAFDQPAEIERIAGQIVLFRLYPRERHEVADQILQAAPFALYRSQELVADLRIEIVDILAQSFDIAEDRGEGRAQLVAGIGHEIGVRAADVRLGRLVHEFDNGKPAIQILAVDPPDVLTPCEPPNHRRSIFVTFEQADCFGLAERHTHVLAENVRTKKTPRGEIGDDDAASLRHDHRGLGMLD